MLTVSGQERLLKNCILCPRRCHVDRNAGNTGYCGQTEKLRVARAALHFWEEPCISGRAGSGAVFFSGCNLRCVYCQNQDIAMGQRGQDITRERLVDIFLELQELGANNINLVTPAHYVPQIAWALQKAKFQGLRIPVVYNTSSYEEVETLRLLEGLVDIYLPDLKYRSSALAARYSNAPDYFEKASAAIREMVRQTGDPVFAGKDGCLLTAAQMNDACEAEMPDSVDGQDHTDADFLMKKGVIVRHLLLPGQGQDSQAVLEWLYQNFQNRIYISIMNQYTPMRRFKKFPELNNRVDETEYERLLDFALELGIENAFVQEGDTAQESFIPAFDGEGVLSGSGCVPDENMI